MKEKLNNIEIIGQQMQEDLKDGTIETLFNKGTEGLKKFLQALAELKVSSEELIMSDKLAALGDEFSSQFSELENLLSGLNVKFDKIIPKLTELSGTLSSDLKAQKVLLEEQNEKLKLADRELAERQKEVEKKQRDLEEADRVLRQKEREASKQKKKAKKWGTFSFAIFPIFIANAIRDQVKNIQHDIAIIEADKNRAQADINSRKEEISVIYARKNECQYLIQVTSENMERIEDNIDNLKEDSQNLQRFQAEIRALVTVAGEVKQKTDVIKREVKDNVTTLEMLSGPLKSLGGNMQRITSNESFNEMCDKGKVEEVVNLIGKL